MVEVEKQYWDELLVIGCVGRHIHNIRGGVKHCFHDMYLITWEVEKLWNELLDIGCVGGCRDALPG
jgi:hypothetical protein